MKNYMSIISLYFEIVFIIFKQYIRVSFIIAHPSELETLGSGAKTSYVSIDYNRSPVIDIHSMNIQWNAIKIIISIST